MLVARSAEKPQYLIKPQTNIRSRESGFFMRYRKLDENGDYSFGMGQTDFLKDTPEAVGQAVLTRLKLWVGEWFANISDGTGWATDVLGKGTSSIYELMLRKRILETQGVLGINDFQAQFDADTRTLSIQINIDTIYGQTTVEGSYS